MTTSLSKLLNSNLATQFFEFIKPPSVPQKIVLVKDKAKLITADKQFREYKISEEIPEYSNPLEGIQEANPMNIAFFSKKNIEILSKRIRYEVYVQSGKENIIGRQSSLELCNVMRSIYLEYSRYSTDKYGMSVELSRLNQIVVNKLVPRLISEIEQYKNYLKDSSQNLIPIQHPISDNLAGTKILRPITDIFASKTIN